MSHLEKKSFPQKSTNKSPLTTKINITNYPTQKVPLIPQVSVGAKRLCPFHSQEVYVKNPIKLFKQDSSSNRTKTSISNIAPIHHQTLSLNLMSSDATVAFAQSYLKNPSLLDSLDDGLSPLKFVQNENIKDTLNSTKIFQTAPSIKLTNYVFDAVIEKLEDDCDLLVNKIKNLLEIRELLMKKARSKNSKTQNLVGTMPSKPEAEKITLKLEGQ